MIEVDGLNHCSSLLDKTWVIESIATAAAVEIFGAYDYLVRLARRQIFVVLLHYLIDYSDSCYDLFVICRVL